MIIKPIYFFVSLAIGLLLNYIITPRPEIIYKYPTPQNVHATIYQDMTDNCYKYKSKEVTCDKKSIENPPQHIDISKKENESFFEKVQNLTKKNIL